MNPNKVPFDAFLHNKLTHFFWNNPLNLCECFRFWWKRFQRHHHGVCAAASKSRWGPTFHILHPKDLFCPSNLNSFINTIQKSSSFYCPSGLQKPAFRSPHINKQKSGVQIKLKHLTGALAHICVIFSKHRCNSPIVHYWSPSLRCSFRFHKGR